MLARRPHVDPALLAVMAEGFFSRLSFGIVSFTLPLFAHHLGMSIGEIGVLVSVNVVAEMVLKPVVAPQIDRFGLRISLIAAVGLRSLVAFLLILASAPWQLLAIRLVHGVSESVRDPSVNAIIAERGGRNAIATSYAWYNTAKTVAGALGKGAAGILLTLTRSDYTLVFSIGFLLSAFPLLVTRYVKDAEPHAPGVRASSAAGSIADIQTERPPVIRYFLFGALISGAASMLSRLFPLLATEYAGLTEAQTGIIYSASMLAIIFAGPLFGWLSDNFSRKLVLSMRSGANIISSMLYILVPTYAGILTAKVLDDTGKAAFRPAWGALMAHVSSFDRARRARVMGQMSLAENIGEAAGPLLAGFLWSSFGVIPMLAARAGLAVFTEIYAKFVSEPLERKGRPSSEKQPVGQKRDAGENHSRNAGEKRPKRDRTGASGKQRPPEKTNGRKKRRPPHRKRATQRSEESS